MTRRDKIGLGILVGLFVVFAALLAYTVKTFGPPRDVKDSVIIKQRVINLRK